MRSEWRRRLVVRQEALILVLLRFLWVEECLDQHLTHFRAIREGEALHVEDNADFIAMISFDSASSSLPDGFELWIGKML